MTVEIKELIIRATITEKSDDDTQKSSDNYNKDELITACVDQVLKILERRNER